MKRANTERPALRARVANASGPQLRQRLPEFPMPTRFPAFVVESKHDAAPCFDIDWALAGGDGATEMQRRSVRNTYAKGRTSEGQTCVLQIQCVEYVASGVVK